MKEVIYFMFKFKKMLVTLGAFGGLLLAGASASANSIYTVKQGDTLSEIALNNGTTIQDILNLNKSITNPNVISVGEQITLPSGQPVQQEQQTTQVAQTQPVAQQHVQQVQQQANTQVSQTQTQSQATTSNVPVSSDNSNKALRRQIESGGNYNTNTCNGYLGAYQFSPSTIASIENATGMKWSMDPSTQDAFADYYANQRYGGWQNVPTTGGW